MHVVETASRHKPAVLLACFVFTTLPLYYGSWRYHNFTKQPQFELQTHISVWSDRFIDEWLEHQLIEPFDSSPLKRYCETMDWRPNLVLNLADANGGIGNIRGNFLDFFLYAIEAGASIMLPGRATRNQENLNDVWAGRAPFDTFFDQEWFLNTMKEACPKLPIYISTEDTKAGALEGLYAPRSRRVDAEPGRDKKAYEKDLEQWLAAQSGYAKEKKLMANCGRTLWEYDTRSLPAGVRRAMGQVLKLNPTVRRIAALVVQKLAQQFDLQIDPREPIPKHAFLGAHLRTEADATTAGWLNSANFSAQTDAYMKQAVAHELRVMYVASGNASELERFKEKAAAHKPSLNVTSKLDLLEGPELEELNNLTWDQQALVDYEVLQRCSVFAGFVRSSFSYNIALTRNQWLDDHGILADPWFVLHSEEAVAFDDGISRIIGRDELHESRIPRGMWP